MKLWPLLLVAACAQPEPEVTVSVTTSFDLVVGDQYARMFLQGDIAGRCTLREPFAAPGTCHVLDDIVDCVPDAASCLVSVSLSGVTIPVTGPEPLLVWSMPPHSSQLRITGCGGEVELELPTMRPPTPVIGRISRAPDGDPSVEWTQDRPAPSAIVTLGPHDLGSQRCHVAAAQSFVFEGFAAVTQREVEVRSLAPVETIATELGPLRIWSGNTAVGMLY